MKNIVQFSGILLAIFFIAACSRSAQPSQPEAVNSTPGPAPTAAATDGSTDGSAFNHVYVMTTTWPDGNVARETLSIGDPVAPAKAPPVSGGTLDSASCLSLDDSHDVVVPFDIKLTNMNTTLSLPSDDGVSYSYMDTNTDLPDGEAVGSVEFFTDGPQCDLSTDSSGPDGLKLIGLQSADDLEPGESAESGGYLVLSGVIQPAHPRGDLSLLATSFLTYTPSPDNSALPRYLSDSWVTAGGTTALPFSAAAGATPTPVVSGSGSPGISEEVITDASSCASMYGKPRDNGTAIGCIPVGTTITIDCTTQGESVTSSSGYDITLWDHTTYDGVSGYISDTYMNPAPTAPVVGSC